MRLYHRALSIPFMDGGSREGNSMQDTCNTALFLMITLEGQKWRERRVCAAYFHPKHGYYGGLHTAYFQSVLDLGRMLYHPADRISH